jgi:serine/threonine protein kinase
MIGKTISHYKILEKLGEGGMGVVYKAHDTKLTRTVALKFLSKNTLGSEQEKARFLREAQAASLLDHPNICTLYDTYDVEDETFIAMAYCDGQRLDEKIAGEPLPVDEAVGIAIQIAEGLNEAHRKGVVHRDIKSANIMLTREGKAKIMDFGLAKLTGRTKLTETATIMGTVDYMSPEQARGETVDHRTDIWSLGVVLYEMLTGRPPFDAESEAALVHKIIYEDPAEMESLAPDTPPGLVAVVSRAMAKDRNERYASVAEFLEDIRNYEFVLPSKLSSTNKRSSTRALSTARPAQPKRARIGAVVALVVILICAGLALLLLLRKLHNFRWGPYRLCHVGRGISDCSRPGLVHSSGVRVGESSDTPVSRCGRPRTSTGALRRSGYGPVGSRGDRFLTRSPRTRPGSGCQQAGT